MKLSPKVKAIAAVLISSAVLFFGWTKYYDFLNQGRRPPESTLILNEMGKSGVPITEFKLLSGETLTLEQLRGKLVILNFWASWCEPCVTEFPSLQNLIKKFEGQIVMIAISGDFEKQEIADFWKAFKVNDPNIYSVWDEDKSISKAYGTFKLPESYVLGKQGELIRKISGVDKWDTAEAIEYFQSLLNDEETSTPN
jgi:cytochrome c biogenesis protein CcmG, thiol:disulfide interchange protein DsbE